ncbi:hypothetical protein P886_2452 [Alteromonadaceae bacterium 2753L.S.0a.02]|nr:hypothetical protein P886_2452 [Alteromonadaceae bacterium 2753L.S.0a.02]
MKVEGSLHLPYRLTARVNPVNQPPTNLKRYCFAMRIQRSLLLRR